MPDRTRLNLPLVVAGAMTAVMGAYHFFLPMQFGWGADLAGDAMLQWALLSINAFFSYLLLMGGVITMIMAASSRPWGPIGVSFLIGMTGFWMFNATYQVLAPMPLPHRLAKLAWVLAGFAIVAAVLYAISMWRHSNRAKSTS